MIAQSGAVKQNAKQLNTRNMIFGNTTEEVIGVGYRGLMADPRMENEYGDLWGFGMISGLNLHDQNKPCITFDEIQNQVRQSTINVDTIPEEKGMKVQPNPASRLNNIGLLHTECDIKGIGNKILRSSNNFNPQLRPAFKALA